MRIHILQSLLRHLPKPINIVRLLLPTKLRQIQQHRIQRRCHLLLLGYQIIPQMRKMPILKIRTPHQLRNYRRYLLTSKTLVLLVLQHLYQPFLILVENQIVKLK